MPSEGTDNLTIRLFGPFYASLNGKPLLREHQVARHLLAYMTLHANQAIETNKLLTTLWDTHEVSPSNLSHTVIQLRRALGSWGSRLVAGGNALSLDLSGADVDVLKLDEAWRNKKIDELDRFVDLYKPLLAGWPGDWVEEAQDLYRHQYADVLHYLAVEAIGREAYSVARRYLSSLVREGDLAESLHRQLMLALIRTEQFVDAGQFYEEYLRHLTGDHHLPPRAMTELYALIPRASANVAPPVPSELIELERVTGATPLETRFYVVRSADAPFHAAVERRDTLVTIKGPRQVGKTSLLVRGREQARQGGARVVTTDFQKLSRTDLETQNSFFYALAWQLHQLLQLPATPDALWNSAMSKMSFDNYVESQVLGHSPLPLVWVIDEADAIFNRDYREEVFSLIRSWFNASADYNNPFRRMCVLMSYSTEAHLLISDLYMSPFNVGERFFLEDFSLSQVADLNRRYDSPLRSADETSLLYDLVGGHPYLVRLCLHTLRARGLDIVVLAAEAERDSGLFGEHLDRLRRVISNDPELLDVVRCLLNGNTHPSKDSFFRLRAAGVLLGDTPEAARFRCHLYEVFLRRRLL